MNILSSRMQHYFSSHVCAYILSLRVDTVVNMQRSSVDLTVFWNGTEGTWQTNVRTLNN